MSTEIAHRTDNQQLAIEPNQSDWTEKQIAGLRQIGIESASEGDLAVFLHQCQRTGLDPFARQIYMIGRNQKNQKTNQWETKYTIQTGIDGFRLIASRTGKLDGYEDTLWCGEDGRWTDVWLGNGPPAAAKVTVIRNGARFPAVALFREYAGTDKQGNLTKMWREKGAVMIAKCAEALALRKAFPQDLSGLYTSEELDQSDTAPRPAHADDKSAGREQKPQVSAPLEVPEKKQIPANTADAIANADTVEKVEKIAGWLQRNFGDDAAELIVKCDERVQELRSTEPESAPEPTHEEAEATLTDALKAEVVTA